MLQRVVRKGVTVSLVERVIGGILRPILERQAKGRSLQEFMSSLERSGEEVTKRLGNAPNTSRNREVTSPTVAVVAFKLRHDYFVYGSDTRMGG